MARKGDGQPARLSYAGHALMENRNGLLVDFRISEANGSAERDTALCMLAEELPGSSPITVGADKAYDTQEFVEQCRHYGVVPHVAQNTTNRASAIDTRTTRHVGYTISQRVRKRIEEPLARSSLKSLGQADASAPPEGVVEPGRRRPADVITGDK